MTDTSVRAAKSLALAAIAALLLAGCSERETSEPEKSIVETDPLLARALTDPLMVDPDLAYRNEANAALTIRYDHPLPPLRRTDEFAELARNAAQNELLINGDIVELPFPSADSGLQDFGALKVAAELLEAAGGPVACASRLQEGLAWAGKMPGPSAIMPHGMVQQAAGTDGNGCSVRVVRYLTPASIDDALQYHFNRADRARLRPVVFEGPRKALVGDGRIEQLVVQARPGPGGLSAIDLVYWAKS